MTLNLIFRNMVGQIPSRILGIGVIARNSREFLFQNELFLSIEDRNRPAIGRGKTAVKEK